MRERTEAYWAERPTERSRKRKPPVVCVSLSFEFELGLGREKEVVLEAKKEQGL